MKRLDLTGRRVGRWTVLGHSDRREFWDCLCDCGTRRDVWYASLTHTRSQSCGCLKSSAITAQNITHGKSKTTTHNIWEHMRARCLNPNHRNYACYGGRGIRVCDRWSVFENFLADMGECPRGMSIDRINNDGHYEPNNCRWATCKQQSRNTRRNRLIELNGKRQPLSAWCEELNLNYSMVFRRLSSGWPTERAFTPSRNPNSHWRNR